MSRTGWKGTSLNAPGIKIHLYHQFLKLCEFHFFHYVLAVGGNKKWLPSLKVHKLQKYGHKMGLMGCIWSSLIVTGTLFILLWSWKNSPFPLMALWGNKKWLPSMKVKKLEKFGNKSGLTGCKWPSLNAKCTESPLTHPFLELGEFPFLHISPLGQ